MAQEILNRVRIIIAEQMAIDAEAIKPESTLDGLGIDSFDKIEIAMKIEEDFECLFANGDEQDIETVQGFVDMVEKAVAHD